MPLLKLWNSLRGRSTQTELAENRAISDAQTVTNAAKTAKRKKSLFGGGPHAGLCKLLKSVPARSVLEISVDDGSRAVAIVETLTKNHADVRYVAIDQFEMAGSEVTLKRFHQRLRAHEIRPKVFPETIQRGLIRVAHTIGPVDLVVIAAETDSWQTPQTLLLLARVSHENTVILCRDGENWRQLEPNICGSLADLQRAA